MTRTMQAPLGFFRWRRYFNDALASDSCIIDTVKGKIEYVIKGDTGPVIVGMHGGPGGYDQSLALWESITLQGYRLLSWSRPGYLRTPLSVGKTYAEQADALAALLDRLGIERVGLFGFSAGGTCALMFAIAYPERVWGLVLESAVCMRYEMAPSKEVVKYILTRLMFYDPVMWLYHILSVYSPGMALKLMLRTESTLAHEKARSLVSKILKSSQKMNSFSKLVRSLSPMSTRRPGLVNDLDQLVQIEQLPMERISVPTLIFHGTADGDVGFEHAEVMHDAIPDSELFAVEDAFHILALSDGVDRIEKKRLQMLQNVVDPDNFSGSE